MDVTRSFSSCLPAPYLYITVHDQIKNIVKYSRDGCLLQSQVLSGGKLSHSELRGVKLGKYMERDALYVADANTDDTQVLVYGECNFQGVRTYRGYVVTSSTNIGASHAYGITFDFDGNIYISFQHTDVVLRFERDTFSPLPFPSALDYKASRFYPGTFLQYGMTGIHEDNQQGVRNIEFVDGFLWVANEDINGVSIVDMNGHIVHTLEVDRPVGVFYDFNFAMVFVASKSEYGAVYGIHPKTYKTLKVYYIDGMEHPTGMTSYGNVLFVAEQSLKQVLTFNIDTTKFIRAIINDPPGKVEQIALTPC